jgi:creatinine amidohydrolase
MAFTGSMTLRPSTLIAVIEDIVSSLVSHGFTHLMFINGHGGNVASMDAAFSEIYAKYSFSNRECPVQCKTVNWYMGKRVSELSRLLYGNAEGHHATPSEVAFTYFLHPEHVKDVTLSPEVAPYGTIRDALDYRRQFPDGRIGSNPSLATPADGKRVWRAAVDDVFEKYQGFIGE